MPRDRTAGYGTEVYQSSEQNTFVASAKGVQGASISAPKNAKRIESQGWQVMAWDWYDTIGEFHYAVNWVGNILSRAKLIVTKKGVVQKSGPAVDLLNQFFGGPEGQAEMLRQTGIHFTVAGDCYYVGTPGKTDSDPDDWSVIAACEMAGGAGQPYKAEKEVIDPKALIIRQWKKHPRKNRYSDSPSRAVLPILSELDGLTKHVAAQIDSRLAGAGLLILPQEMSFGVAPVTTEDTNGDDTGPAAMTGLDGFLETLRNAMMTAIQNRTDASAIVPILVQAPGDVIDKVQYLTFWTELDATSQELRKEAIGRLGLGMDMPPEILQGTADMNHWSSWQVEDAAIKAHTEPLLDVVTQGITVAYLQASLKTMNIPDWQDYEVDADTTGMRMRPNRSKESLELNDRGIMSDEATMRENGFEVSDIMTKTELESWLTRKVAGGSATPDMVNAALRDLGVELVITPVNVRETINERVGPDGQPIAPPGPQTPVDKTDIKPTDQTPNESRPVPSLKGHPQQNPPDVANAAAAEAMVFRALERVGNKIKNRKGYTVPSNIEPIDLYMYDDGVQYDPGALLEGAWALCDRLGIDAATVQQLDSYARELIVARKPHNRNLMLSFMTVSEHV